MTKGVGIDIVQVERIKEKLAKKILNNDEEFISKQHLAGVFACKEAVVKAMGCGIGEISFKDITIAKDKLGKPVAILSQKAKEKLYLLNATNICVSISHEKKYAVAFAVID